MIISREHRFVYVALPRTGCTAVEKELVSQYGGESILKKHSTYRDFLRQASDEERRFFAFSNIRNPLDDAVSHYFKLKTDHNRRFTDETRRRVRVGNRGAEHLRRTGEIPRGGAAPRRSFAERLENRRFDYVRRHDADFGRFFRRYYRLPYDTWARLSHRDLDFVIRFEQIQRDFSQALAMIGLEQVRELPVRNKTVAKSTDYTSYYTEDLVPRAVFVYGPYMRRWGYDFPAEWDVDDVPRRAELAYSALAMPRTIYWNHLRRGN